MKLILEGLVNNNLKGDKSMSKKQVTAVYEATINVLTENGVHWEDGMNASEVLTPEMRKCVIAMVVAGFAAGEVELSAEGKAKYDTEAKLKSYTSGMVSNHLRKDKRLNGGEKYTAKNPGSRVGAGDEQIKALKMLRDMKADDVEAVAAIDLAIEARKLELAPKSTTTISAEQLALIPADIRAKLGL
jgi:hypothetical protein